ncbi:hypothetical protein CC78DRAFT_537436 [Lojkania enalia]|uniref:BCAS2 family protein n=1 Tax=Lojkania enalia TaxID=147567 RepID=A0A9P4K3T0_9PLEO|nr:hypothetical protein CC78DRAFT_537436 [Didymosphaeria enalia]
MPLINESYDSLPYVDAPPDPASLAAAKALIDADVKTAGVDAAQLHPALIPAALYTPQFTDALQHEHARLQAHPSSKLSAIDLKRYEDLEAPPNTSPTSDEDRPELLERWIQVLKRAYTSSEYLNARVTELGLLEKFGKNAWLIGNAQLEDILKAIETDLASVKKQQEEVDALRRSQQESVGGEIKALEETWRTGVERMLATQVAVEGLKRQILERRRAGAI